jgi:hypothetical protein
MAPNNRRRNLPKSIIVGCIEIRRRHVWSKPVLTNPMFCLWKSMGRFTDKHRLNRVHTFIYSYDPIIFHRLSFAMSGIPR